MIKKQNNLVSKAIRNSARELSWKSGCSYACIRNAREQKRIEDIVILEKEGARFVPGYSSYLVKENGDIYSTLNRRVIKLRPGAKKAGYLFVGLTDDFNERKYEMVHRIVAKTFLPMAGEYLTEINHKDGVKNNNHISNLEWVTAKMNIRHAIETGLLQLKTSKLDNKSIKEIFLASGSYKEIGCKYGVSAQTVCNIKNKKNKCYKKIFGSSYVQK